MKLVLLSGLWSVWAITGVATPNEKPTLLPVRATEPLVCQLQLISVACEQYANDTDCQDIVACSPWLGDNQWSVHSFPFRGVSQETFLPFLIQISQGLVQAVISNGSINQHVAVVPHGAKVQLVLNSESGYRRRKLSNAIGVHNVVVLRISTPDSQPTLSASQLFDRFFASSSNPTLASQYAACSTGALQMQQRVRGTGVVDIILSATVNAYTNTNAMVVEATNLFMAQFNLEGSSTAITDFADHILFVLPPNSFITTPWIATAVVGGWRVVCNDVYCGFLSIFMHEVGHNLGLLHANQNGAYNDRTGYMGSGVGVDYYPRECFNAANHWKLNWYSARQLHVEPSNGAVSFNLAAFVNHNETSIDQPVVVQIGNSHYLQYNWAGGYNSDTVMYPNMVVYVQDLLTSTELLAALAFDGMNQRFVETNFENTGNDLVLEVCGSDSNTPATIAVGVGYNANQSPCSQGQLVGMAGPILGTPYAPETLAPSSPPSSSPAMTNGYRDSPNGTFPVRLPLPSRLARNRNCAWLRSRPQCQRIHCASNQLAQSTCAQTCGSCGSGSLCQDNAAAKFLIVGMNRSCRWVASYSRHLCQKHKIIRNECAKTCQKCAMPALVDADVVEATEKITAMSSNTSLAPEYSFDSVFTESAYCKDRVDATFPDTRVGRNRTCAWLSKRSYIIHKFCTRGEVARTSCPMTCGLC